MPAHEQHVCPLKKIQKSAGRVSKNRDCSKKYVQVRPQGALKETIQSSWESFEAIKVAVVVKSSLHGKESNSTRERAIKNSTRRHQTR